jgi:hypothetical protein
MYKIAANKLIVSFLEIVNNVNIFAVFVTFLLDFIFMEYGCCFLTCCILCIYCELLVVPLKTTDS